MKKYAFSAGCVCAGFVCLWLAGAEMGAGMLALAAAALWTGKYFLQCCDRRKQVCFGTAGFLLALACALGARLDAAGETGWAGLALCVLAGAFFVPAAGGVCMILEKGTRSAGREENGKRVFLHSWILLLMAWLPVLLAFYPGVYGYDADGQLSQVISGNYTTHHPLLHTLLMGAFYRLGEWVGRPEAGWITLTVFQMSVLSAAAAYSIWYLSRLGCPRWIRVIILVIFMVLPVHSVMAVTFTKDVLFAACILVCLVNWHRMMRNPSLLKSKRFVLGFAAVTVIMCLLRNNAPIALVLSAAAAVLMRRGFRRRMLALLVACLVLSAGMGKGLERLTDAASGSVGEMLSIPAQQTARVFHRYGYSEPVGYEIVEWVPHAENYHPERSDYVKLHLNIKTGEKLTGFLKFWIREFFHYPIEYLDAFLYTTKGYWHMGDTSYACTYTGADGGITAGAMLCTNHSLPGLEGDSAFPWLRRLYERLFLHNECFRIPVLNVMVGPALWVWLLICALAWAVWERRWDVLACAALPFAYLLTLLLGPVALVRYGYYLMLCVPVLLGMLCSPKENES